jgi:hypothetical protein
VRHKVFGYHGTTLSAAKAIMADPMQFQSSTSEGDWLGQGIYFFENSFRKGTEWALRTFDKCSRLGDAEAPAVLGCEIDLSNCLDLCDPRHSEDLQSWVIANFDLASGPLQHAPRLLTVAGKEISVSDLPYRSPKNRALYHHPHKVNVLDKVLIDAFVDALPANKRFSTVRAPFNSGRQLFPNSYLFHNSQVQIAVRDPERAMLKLQIVDGPMGRRRGSA